MGVGPVDLTTKVHKEHLEQFYRLAGAFVMPGRGEGFGIVYLEALACGVPVVASKADASREAVLDRQMGFVVNPDNPEETRDGILSALRQKRGIVPSGLIRFSRESFDQRCAAILGECAGLPSALETRLAVHRG
ncbi:MAG: glycosyltransferase family 4 protein [Verrucomicrobia bacterium]|nr:glycosyltransferase family 4 protein [Verrucomicrobiota bacterium]